MQTKCSLWIDFTNYFHHYKPFDQAVTLAAELKVSFSLDGDGRCQVAGYSDRDQRPACRCSDGAYEVHDLGTAASPPDEAKLD